MRRDLEGKEAKPVRAASGKRPYTRARKIVLGLVFASVVVSLIWHTGTGTPSAFGISSIAAVCPLASLETMLAGRNLMLHPLVLFALSVVAALLLGKVFCAWVCPTSYLQRLFGRKHEAGGDKASSTLGAGDSAAEPARGNVGAADAGAVGVADAAEAAVAGAAATAYTAYDSSVGTLAADSATDATATADSVEKPASTDGAAAVSGEEGSGSKALAPIGGRRDGLRFDGRHLVLIGALASSFVFGFPVFCLVCPVGLTFGTFIGLWHLFQYNEVSWMLVAMPVVLVFELVVLRRWCTTLCPISALVSLISAGNKTVKPRVCDEACLRSKGVDCRVCVDHCPEEVDPHTENIPECSKCGICIEGCPAHAIEMKLLAFSKQASSSK